jgi:hypothetical protein
MRWVWVWHADGMGSVVWESGSPRIGGDETLARTEITTMRQLSGCDCTRVDFHCSYCGLLVGLDGYHVMSAHDVGDRMVVMAESAPGPAPGCPSCGVVAASHGRRDYRLVDVPCFGRPAQLVWRKRTWRCPDRNDVVSGRGVHRARRRTRRAVIVVDN